MYTHLRYTVGGNLRQRVSLNQSLHCYDSLNVCVELIYVFNDFSVSILEKQSESYLRMSGKGIWGSPD